MRTALSIAVALLVALVGPLLCADIANEAADDAAVTVHSYMTGLDAASSKQAIADDPTLAGIMAQDREYAESSLLSASGTIALLCFGAGALASSGRGKRANRAKRQAPRPEPRQAPEREVVYITEPAPAGDLPSDKFWGRYTLQQRAAIEAGRNVEGMRSFPDGHVLFYGGEYASDYHVRWIDDILEHYDARADWSHGFSHSDDRCQYAQVLRLMPYVKRPAGGVMTKAEWMFWRKALAPWARQHGFMVSFKPSLRELADISPEWGKPAIDDFHHFGKRALREASQKHVDFLVLDKAARVVCAVELNDDASHAPSGRYWTEQRAASDKFKELFFEKVGYPLVVIAGGEWSPETFDANARFAGVGA